MIKRTAAGFCWGCWLGVKQRRRRGRCFWGSKLVQCVGLEVLLPGCGGRPQETNGRSCVVAVIRQKVAGRPAGADGRPPSVHGRLSELQFESWGVIAAGHGKLVGAMATSLIVLTAAGLVYPCGRLACPVHEIS